MGLSLTIENESRLADGGPLTYRLAGKRGADIGRDSHLDWTLPDPSRYVSGKHCEIRYRDGGYWLTDVSTNGTFLNGSDTRIQSPYRLHHGDRLAIGHYIVAVELDGEEAADGAPIAAPAAFVPYADLWSSDEDAAPPVDPRDLRPAAQAAPGKPDFLEWAVDVPDANKPGFALRPMVPQPSRPVPEADAAWAQGAVPREPEAAPPAAVPNPRRPVWLAEPGGPWSDQGEPAGREPAQPGRAREPERNERPAAGELDFLSRFARGAALPENALANVDPGVFAERLGALMLLTVGNVMQLLKGRVEAKRAARSANQTMLQALDNNPLKFSPSAAEALRILFGPPTRSYLEAAPAFRQSFEDLKAHQIKTFTAMQQALQMLVEDLDPQTIENETDGDRGIGAMLGSRKARLWDAYRARWHAKTHRQEGGMVSVFMSYFAECYDRLP
jgi:type VI secretion system protein ImpI